MGPLDSIAARASREPFFLGSLLDRLARAEQLDEAALAERLGCDPVQLPRLRLCRTPLPDRFREDVTRIAEAFRIESARLAAFVQAATVLERLEAPSQADAPLLMAARDSDGDQP